MTSTAKASRIRVPGFDDDKNDLVTGLVAQLEAKSRRNALRAAHYDAKHLVASVSAILPPQYKNHGLVLGWTGKAVDLLARRCNLDGFEWPGEDLDSLGAAELHESNQLGAEINQGLTSALVHSFAIATTVKGEPEAREPGVLFQMHDALTSTGEYNARRHALESALVVNDRHATNNQVTDFTLHEFGSLTTCRKSDGKWSIVSRDEHGYGMTADVVPFRPRLRRAFGSSRITRPMMAIQDAAVRALLRLEGHMDIYSYPELILLGADASVFKDRSGATADTWQVMMGRLKAIPDDEDAVNPRADVKQFSASSPEPHLADINALAKMFAREASLPDSSLAITDLANPTSADSYDASQYDLIADAEGATDDWTPGIKRAYLRALAMQNQDPGLPDRLRAVSLKWRNPRFLSRAAQADAGMKQLTAAPWLAETDVGLELLGLDRSQQERALAERDRTRASSTAERIIAAARQGAQGGAT